MECLRRLLAAEAAVEVEVEAEVAVEAEVGIEIIKEEIKVINDGAIRTAAQE